MDLHQNGSVCLQHKRMGFLSVLADFVPDILDGVDTIFNGY